MAAAPPQLEPAIRTFAMPGDTNPAGDIFGGWLMAQMDLAAGNVAARRAHGRCATIAVDKITFHTPVKVGDEVTVDAELVAVGRCGFRSQPGAGRAIPSSLPRSPRRSHLRDAQLGGPAATSAGGPGSGVTRVSPP
jgi:acyl-CoA thioesterase YciA